VGKWLKGVFPISTGVVVSALAQPQWLMEIDVTAVIPDDWQGRRQNDSLYYRPLPGIRSVGHRH
jgi:hypothetical protein